MNNQLRATHRIPIRKARKVAGDGSHRDSRFSSQPATGADRTDSTAQTLPPKLKRRRSLSHLGTEQEHPMDHRPHRNTGFGRAVGLASSPLCDSQQSLVLPASPTFHDSTCDLVRLPDSARHSAPGHEPRSSGGFWQGMVYATLISVAIWVILLTPLVLWATAR